MNLCTKVGSPGIFVSLGLFVGDFLGHFLVDSRGWFRLSLPGWAALVWEFPFE